MDVTLSLAHPAQHVEVPAGGEIVLRGALRSTIDGSIVDAASTTSAPPGVDSGGLIDFEAGGFHVTSRDVAAHEVHAVATGTGAACAKLGVASPCLPLRLLPQAQSRLLTIADYRASLTGSIVVESPSSPAHLGDRPTARTHAAASVLLLVMMASALLVVIASSIAHLRRRARSPLGRLLAIADRVRGKAERIDPTLAAPLRPALSTALSAIRARRVDPASPQGQRVADTLLRLEAKLDDAAVRARTEREAHVADEVIADMEAAVRAAEETMAL